MRIGLIDVDGRVSVGNTRKRFPNLCLMKISAWHKAQGDLVEWYMPFNDRYDIVYLSKVFSFSPDYDLCINADKVVRGGSGYAIKLINGKEVYDQSKDQPLPAEVETMMPDYSIYNITDTAYGFLTRGCPRGCGFCHVAAKEGKRSYKVADLSQFWSGQKNVILSDPNILACKDWKELLQQLIDAKVWVDFNQGLDIRMMNEERAEMLSKIKIKEIHFAWDRYQDKEMILPKFKTFAEHNQKILKAHHCLVFTLVNFDTTLEQDLERIYTLKEMGFWAYVMVYDKEHCDPVYRKLQRWVNNRYVFFSCERFEDYDSKRA